MAIVFKRSTVRSRSESVTRSVLVPRPAARRDLLFRDLPKTTFSQRTRKLYLGLSENASLGTWERGTLAAQSAGVSRLIGRPHKNGVTS